MRHLLFSLLFLFGLGLRAQYWFGPKAGIQLTNHVYQSSTYESDSFKINPSIGWQVGGVMTYTASKMFSVHAEINYENIGKTLHNREKDKNDNIIPFAYSKYRSHYISVPIMLRVNFGNPPFHFYVNGGPNLNFWLTSIGEIYLEEFDEFSPDTLSYKMVYRQSKANGSTKLAFRRANRVQYGFALGGGAYFDLPNNTRIMVDLRYNYGNSNMGFNGSPNFSWDTYQENFEYKHHAITASIGYMIEFNAQMKRKGRSTNKESNRKR